MLTSFIQILPFDETSCLIRAIKVKSVIKNVLPNSLPYSP